MLQDSQAFFGGDPDCAIFYYYSFLEPELLALKQKLGNRLQLFENQENRLLAEEHLNENFAPKGLILVIEDQQTSILVPGSQELRRGLLRLFQVNDKNSCQIIMPKLFCRVFQGIIRQRCFILCRQFLPILTLHVLYFEILPI